MLQREKCVLFALMAIIELKQHLSPTAFTCAQGLHIFLKTKTKKQKSKVVDVMVIKGNTEQNKPGRNLDDKSLGLF